MLNGRIINHWVVVIVADATSLIRIIFLLSLEQLLQLLLLELLLLLQYLLVHLCIDIFWINTYILLRRLVDFDCCHWRRKLGADCFSTVIGKNGSVIIR